MSALRHRCSCGLTAPWSDFDRPRAWAFPADEGDDAPGIHLELRDCPVCGSSRTEHTAVVFAASVVRIPVVRIEEVCR